MKFIKRTTDLKEIQHYLETFPAVAILGARQCGKTTIAQEFEFDHYFDLENPVDLGRLDNPKLALENITGLIVIDEIQLKPDLFPLLRYLIDNHPKQKYLILGSASRDLIHQSSESLAGRIANYELGGFRIHDFTMNNNRALWMRGGYPKSVLAHSETESIEWREQYIKTFLERDIPMLGIRIPAHTLRRFWTMISHYHGQLLNHAELGRSFGISDMTVRKYLDILESTFMIRILQPWHINIGKRLIKQPKIYLRDSGIFHTLSSIENYNQLHANPKLGVSWEGFALEAVCRSIGKQPNSVYFWRTSNGAELDLYWQAKGQNWGVEFKYADAPKLTKSMKIANEDLNLSHLWVVYPGTDCYSLTKNISVLPFENVSSTWDYSH
ncbi:MAG: ATP-binding protein [Fidelibacterota bacterium]